MPVFIAKLGVFIASVFGQTVEGRAAKVIGIATAAVLLAGAAVTGKVLYDRHVIAKHEAAEKAKDMEAALRGERAANSAQAERDKQSAETAEKLKQATGSAKLSDPVGAAAPVGPTTKAYYDTLRKEKKQ
jgi:hypothetical protein